MNKQVVVTTSPNIMLILAIVFFVLKVTGTISWPWLWVLSPLWLPPVAILTILAVAAMVVFTVAFVGSLFNK